MIAEASKIHYSDAVGSRKPKSPRQWVAEVAELDAASVDERMRAVERSAVQPLKLAVARSSQRQCGEDVMMAAALSLKGFLDSQVR